MRRYRARGFLQIGDLAACNINPSMSAAMAVGKPLGRLDVPAMLIRWKLGVEYLEELDMNSLPSEQALRFLIRHDFPVLLKELIRLRPELA
jgi:hypothetical protein